MLLEFVVEKRLSTKSDVRNKVRLVVKVSSFGCDNVLLSSLPRKDLVKYVRSSNIIIKHIW